ncbi:MAG: NADH-quinone oxidoreductase subunit I [Bacteroidota bacterium]
MAEKNRLGKALKSLLTGFQVTQKHLKTAGEQREHKAISDPNYFEDADKAVTIQYPMEKIPVPDMGRYRLHMESEDCIACDKCARICPVDCITIDSFKAVDDLGYTSDGSKKRLELAVFDIDMAKCCYCGLCTTACPTECLTMTKVYDYSEFDRDELVYHFGVLTPEDEADKRQKLEAAQQAKKQVGTAKKKGGFGLKKASS